MLEDELLLVAGFEYHRVLIERSDTPRQLHAADQIDRNIVPFLSCRVEEGILNVLLCRLGFHLPISFFWLEAAREHREGQSAAALFLSAPTIRPCQALFNFPRNNNLGRRPCASRAQGYVRPTEVRPPQKIDRVSFPSPAIYNRQFHNRVSE